jgi:hypothetical protein
MKQRRASREISLVLVGAAMLQGCGPDLSQSLTQDNYRSLEDCQADWGRPEWCERVPDTRSRSGFLYRGPSYSVGSRAAAQSATGGHAASGTSSNRSLGSSAAHSTARGGFGASAHAHSGGG